MGNWSRVSFGTQAALEQHRRLKGEFGKEDSKQVVGASGMTQVHAWEMGYKEMLK